MSVNYWLDVARIMIESIMAGTSWGMFIGTFSIFLLTLLTFMMLSESRRL